jgi:hypothetical protein
VEAELGSLRARKETRMMRKVIYALASLAALAMAVGAGWKPV